MSTDKIMILLRISSCFIYVRSSEISNICRTSIRHLSKMENMKKLMMEMKWVFGSLLETDQQKIKRLTSEAKGKIPRQTQNKIDTEFSWVMEQSLNNFKKSSLKRITLISAKQQSGHEGTSRKNSTNSPENSNTETTECKRSSTQKNNPKKSNLKRIILVSAKQPSEHSDMSLANSTNSPKNLSTETLKDERPSNQNTENTVHSEPNRQKITPETTNQNKLVENNNSHDNTSLSDSNVTDIENAAKPNAFEKHFHIIVKNIQSFSIMDNKRKSSAGSTETSPVFAKKDQSIVKFPSVTRILTHTMSPESKLALEMWKKKMIKQLGQEGFDKYQRALLNDGTSLHSCIAHHLLGKEYEISPRIEPVFNSVQSVLKNICHVKAIETYVGHTKLRYKGIVDCVASYRGENYVIDWKKSDKKKLELKETYDAPVQVAAYIGAINASNLYPFVIKRGLIVIAYTCGDPATVHEICDDTLQEYWTIWLRRLQQYHVDTASNDSTSNKTLM